MTQHQFDFTVCTSSDADEMARVLAEAFTQHEPAAKALDLTQSEFESFVQLLCPKAAREALTIVARSADTGELVGAMLTDDLGGTPVEGLDRLSPKFDPIFDLLDQLEHDYQSERHVPTGEAIHLFLLGVSPRWMGHGIAHRMIATCLANGAAKNYRMAVTEATNKTSQHVFRKLGFAERVHRSYADHRFAGEARFASIAHVGGPILMDRPCGDT